MRERIDYDALRLEVKAEHDKLRACGVYPSVDRIWRSLRRMKSAIEVVRRELIADGLLDFGGMSGYQNMVGPLDDPNAEPPDDPDAAEIEARIAAVRESKRDRFRPVMVTHARGLKSNPRPRSRQAASF